VSVQHLIELGDASRKSKDYLGAIPCYLKALEAEPDHGQALLGLAAAHRGNHDLARAIEALKRYVACQPGNAMALSRLADAYRKIGRADLAVEHYREALALEPRHRDQEALVHWELLLETLPDHVNILTKVGGIHRRQRDFEQAMRCFTRALALAPDNPYALFGMADSLRGMGRSAEAMPLWKAFLEADPGNQQALSRAGDCCLRLGRLAEAEGYFTTCLGLGFHRPALLGLGRVHRDRGEPAAAVACYQRILARDPADARTILLRIDTLREWKGPKGALAYLEGPRTAHPGLDPGLE
jgi:tetratricopeptide (TPR) repeat protein